MSALDRMPESRRPTEAELAGLIEADCEQLLAGDEWSGGLVSSAFAPAVGGRAVGGYGSVGAYRTPHGAEIAVKAPLAGIGGEGHIRLNREYLLLHACDHPNVIKAYGRVGAWLGDDEARDLPYAMELAVTDLGNEAALGPDRVQGVIERIGGWRALIEQMLEGVIALRATALPNGNRMIAHRDIKPANTLIGKDGRIKIADPGIQRTLEVDPLTKVVPDCGAFACPDQLVLLSPGETSAQIREKFDSVDVHGIAAVVAYLATRSAPYTNAEYRTRIFREQRVVTYRADLLAAGIDEELADWLDVACEPAGKHRFRTPELALQALRQPCRPKGFAAAVVAALHGESKTDDARLWDRERALRELTRSGGAAAAQAWPQSDALAVTLQRVAFGAAWEGLRPRTAVRLRHEAVINAGFVERFLRRSDQPLTGARLRNELHVLRQVADDRRMATTLGVDARVVSDARTAIRSDELYRDDPSATDLALQHLTIDRLLRETTVSRRRPWRVDLLSYAAGVAAFAGSGYIVMTSVI